MLDLKKIAKKLILILPKKLQSILQRIWIIRRYYKKTFNLSLDWIFHGQEDSNFNYSLTESNLRQLAHLLSLVTNTDVQEIYGFFEEILNDVSVKDILRTKKQSRHENEVGLGRRIGWYALVRALKPKLTVETGVDEGIGAVIICKALSKNHQEGFNGTYLGTEIRSNAGKYFTKEYAKYGKIQYGDSVESLKMITNEIDVFINDSDHDPVYELLEYETVVSKMSINGFMLSDNSHATDVLIEFSEKYNRKFVFFKESPKGHWYPGAGIGISLREIFH